MTKRKSVTWTVVREAIKSSNGFFYLSYDDYDRRVLRCNNGWIQARSPRNALALVLTCN
jgi:hypothetical protein